VTRSVASARARELSLLPNVSLLEGQYTDESFLKRAFEGAYGAFVNTDGFTLGERAEVYWGMRIFELAAAAGVKHYVWGALDYSLKYGKYKEEFRCGHYDGKGRVTEWLLAQKGLDIVPSVLTTGPYMEMLYDGMFVPKLVEGGKTLEFRQPLGPHGKVPMVALEDVGVFGLWVFDNFDQMKYRDLKVATAHVDFNEVVAAFNSLQAEKGGNMQARWKPLPMSQFFADMGVPKGVPVTQVFDSSARHGAEGMTFEDNFSGFWTLWSANVVERDYALLDEIHPGRVRSVREWMEKHSYDGKPKKVLADNTLGNSKKALFRFVMRKVSCGLF